MGNSLFDYLKSINETKQDLSVGENFDTEYPPFMINRGIAQGLDGIFVAEELNRLSGLDKELHYKFLLHFMTKKKRYNKWSKKEAPNESLKLISEHYNCSLEKAEEYLKILNEDQMARIKQLQEPFDPRKKPK